MAQDYDDFNRADANPLDGDWSAVTGGGALPRLVSNKVKPIATGVPYLAVNTAAGSNGATQFAQITIDTIGSGTNIPGLLVCYSTAADTGYRLQYNGADLLSILRVTAGSSTSIGSFAHTLANGEIIKLVYETNAVKAYVDGVLEHTVSSETTYQSGYSGFLLYASSSVDNLIVDDFYGGDGTEYTPGGGTKYWLFPANATEDTTARLIVMATGTTPSTIAQEGLVVADANGDFKLLDTTDEAVGTERLAFAHNYAAAASAFNGVGGVAEIIEE